MFFYPDDAELAYHCTPKGSYGHGTLTAKFGREICAKTDGTPKRWMVVNGRRWCLDSAHRNRNKFRPTAIRL